MSDTSKDILRTFDALLKKIDDQQKEKLLCFGEGMAFMAEQQAAQQAAERG